MDLARLICASQTAHGTSAATQKRTQDSMAQMAGMGGKRLVRFQMPSAGNVTLGNLCADQSAPDFCTGVSLAEGCQSRHSVADTNHPEEITMPEIAPWAFVLAVPDFNRSAAYFRDILGFRILWEDATDWRLAERDGVRVMIGNCPNDVAAAETRSHNLFAYLSVSNVDDLHDELSGRGANCSKPTDTAYGMREIVVTTIDGHRIIFGQDAQPQNS